MNAVNGRRHGRSIVVNVDGRSGARVRMRTYATKHAVGFWEFDAVFFFFLSLK